MSSGNRDSLSNRKYYLLTTKYLNLMGLLKNPSISRIYSLPTYIHTYICPFVPRSVPLKKNVYPSTQLSMCASIQPSISSSSYPSILFLHPCITLPIQPFIHLSFHSSIYATHPFINTDLHQQSI